MALAVDPTAIPVGAALAPTHHGFALVAIRAGSLTSLRVALEGPRKRLITVDDRRAMMVLASSVGPPEGLLVAAKKSANLPAEGSWGTRRLVGICLVELPRLLW